MINILIPIVEDVEGFVEFIRKNKSKDCKFFVGIRKKLSSKFVLKSKNVEVRVFEDKANKEEIINSLHSSQLENGKILIVRRPLTDVEFYSLTNSTKDIVTLKAKHNKFVSALKNWGRKIVKKFFAFNFFEDISAICYSETMFKLLSVCPNLSMASRINKYVGVEVEEIETEEKQVKKDYSKVKSVLTLLAGILFFLGSLAGGICVCLFTTLWALNVVLVIAWLFIALALMLVSIVNFTRIVAVGNLRYGKALEIK